MKNISLSLNHNQVESFAFITWNVAALLLQSKNNLYRLAGWHLHKLHHRLNEKKAVVYSGEKKVRLNICEILCLHQFINYQVSEDDVYTQTVRMQIFTLLDSML